MGTRSFIGMKKPSGEIVRMYCHWDGYPEGVGRTLAQHYSKREQVEALLKLGYASSLESTPESTYAEAVEHNRDRKPEVFANEKEFIESFVDSWCEYFYLYKKDRWVFRGGGSRWKNLYKHLKMPEPIQLWMKRPDEA